MIHRVAYPESLEQQHHRDDQNQGRRNSDRACVMTELGPVRL